MKTVKNNNGYEFVVFEKNDYVFERPHSKPLKKYKLHCDAVLLESHADRDAYDLDSSNLPAETIDKYDMQDAGLVD